MKKLKFRYKRILILISAVVMITITIFYFSNLKISNIYVYNDEFLNEQYIIEVAKIENYPSAFTSISKIKNNLIDSIYIKDATVSKKSFTEIHIEVEENIPLFYYEFNKKTVLTDGQTVDDVYDVPHLINYVTDTYYDRFVKEMSLLDEDVIKKITQIEFKPNDLDDSLFYLTMSDGNFVYVNIFTFEKMNSYLSVMTSLPDKNGILYFDYGNNFEILE